ncbi:MAG: non-ribosomal peptide synthetase, partial [Anaerolineae bacterium]|nr:non-ribosomal peptide synthetase [Anaerolineae bacterium]
MSGTTEPTANLSSEEKRALLARLLRERASTSGFSYPLSRGQQALWFLYQLAPESVAYNVMYAWRICSNLDVSVLRSAFQALVNRHPSLRTTCAIRDGKPVQEVHQYQEVHFEVIDASAWNEGYLREHLAKIAHTPFDLERGPVLRVYLVARSSLEYVLLLTAHHIAIDGWSLEVLLDELGTLYVAVRDGTGRELPSLDLQYT